MSRVGQKPVTLPAGIKVAVQGRKVSVSGPKGELAYNLPDGIDVAVDGSVVSFLRGGDTRELRSLHGLVRSLVANMVTGVQQGFVKELEIQGVGFKAAVQGQNLVLSLGFASPVEYEIPTGVKVAVDGGVAITVTGADRQLVGDVAARIRGYFPAEPYKGKGIRYKGERVRRKVGKTVA
ncbi:MAG: 50S ribosomal protein L6 [Lentisphaerae bacterium]|nr:50S ribosomal protein L6 [Lentisphaerota bacterium]